MSGQKSLQPPDLQTLKMADQAEQFFHFTYIFLCAHLDGVKRKICAIKKTNTMFCIKITSRNELQKLKVDFCNKGSAHFCVLRFFHFFTNETTKINYQFLNELNKSAGTLFSFG